MKDRVVPLIKLYDYLIVPVQIELDDSTVEKMQNQILDAINDKNVRGIIIDVSMVEIIDSYISYILSETAGMAKLMGCHTALCGIQPQVALTLAQMGVEFKDIISARNLEDAINILDSLD